MHCFAHSQLPHTAPDHFGVSTLGEVHLIFNHLHHRLARRKEMDRGKLVIGENGRNSFHLAQQGVIVGAGCAPDINPCCVVLPKQIHTTFLKGISLLYIRTQGKPPRKEVTTKRHIFLPISFNLRIYAFQFDVCIREVAPLKGGLCPHDFFCALPMVVRDFVIMGHTLVHLCKLALQLAWRTVEHHQNRG